MSKNFEDRHPEDRHQEARDLEAQLRTALRRQDPPAGFAERVVLQAEAAREQRRVQTPRPRFRLLWPAATLAATTALMLSISIEYRAVQEEKVQEERAGQQAIQALRIASQKLNMARNKVLNKESK